MYPVSICFCAHRCTIDGVLFVRDHRCVDAGIDLFDEVIKVFILQVYAVYHTVMQGVLTFLPVTLVSAVTFAARGSWVINARSPKYSPSEMRTLSILFARLSPVSLHTTTTQKIYIYVYIYIYIYRCTYLCQI